MEKCLIIYESIVQLAPLWGPGDLGGGGVGGEGGGAVVVNQKLDGTPAILY